MVFGRRSRHAASTTRAGRRTFAEIERLSARNRTHRDPHIEAQLVRLRHDAFSTLQSTPSDAWPPMLEDPFPEVADQPPEIPATALTADILGGAIRHHGSLLVRGLVDAPTVAKLVDDVDRAFAARGDVLDDRAASTTPQWFDPFEPGGAFEPIPAKQRDWVRECGAMWAADSPATFFDIVEMFTAARIPDLVSEYLGERAVLSLNKCALRRISGAAHAAWHQDGTFLGPGVRTVDVWIALSDCGGDSDAPGLDIVPRRFHELSPTMTGGAIYPIVVGGGQIDQLSTKPVRPAFAKGDALVFDEMMLHATASGPGLTRERYALESWFFAPSTFPPMYVPLVL